MPKRYKYGDTRPDGFRFGGYRPVFSSAGRKLYGWWTSPEVWARRKVAGEISRLKVRMEVYAHYGNKCLKCGEKDLDVLTIDHIAQNGAEHRRSEKITDAYRMHLWLRKNNFPKGFRVLCFNCNIKEFRKYQRRK